MKKLSPTMKALLVRMARGDTLEAAHDPLYARASIRGEGGGWGDTVRFSTLESLRERGLIAGVVPCRQQDTLVRLLPG